LFPTVNNKNLAWQGYAQNGCRTLHFLLAKYKTYRNKKNWIYLQFFLLVNKLNSSSARQF
ncbi:hypothetical protein, partial [Brevibacillus brevis]|uniref:hypothetical protein n=1 Tax=Brevibacillus brevis TaxID=1393 RepID=UPI0037CA88A6